MRRLSLVMAAVASALMLGACQGKKSSSAKPAETTDAKTAGKILICVKCGQVKGSDVCCKEGAAKCGMCGLHKDSPGCCRLGKATEDVCLCTHCGEIKGSDKCCKEGAAKCSKCGLNKDSPGCCRITMEKM